MNLQIKKATKQAAKLRMGLIGPAGSGKTFSALSIAEHLGKRVLVVDTERGSASKYADLFTFDVVELDTFEPDRFIEVIQLVNKMPDGERYDVLIIDSLSHAWIGKGGVLEMHDNAQKRGGGNSFTAWRDVTPKHNALVDAILGCRSHVIATMRAKTEHVQEKDEKTGKTVIRKVGMAPVQRDGFEYEFDVIADLDWENNCIIGKTRCPMLSGKIYNKAGANIAEVLNVWLQGEKTIVVKMPPKTEPVQPIAAEVTQTRTDELKQHRDAKEIAPVSPETKGRLLAEGGFVARNNLGYEVTDTEDTEIYQITQVTELNTKIIKCTCANYRDSYDHGAPHWRCAHIHALSFHHQLQKQAA